MKKYWAHTRVSVQNTLAYRGPIFVWLIGNLLTLVTIIAVWLSSSAGETIAGYTQNELISYYVAALFLWWLIGWLPMNWVKEDIKDGTIVGEVLTKPISFYWRAFFGELGWHLVSAPLGLLATLIVVSFTRQYFVFTVSPHLLWAGTATILSTLLMFTFSLCIGLLAFWFTHISTAITSFWAALAILGGQGIPISFLPKSVALITYVLPFRYLFSFPLEIYFQKLSLLETLSGLLLQLGWLAIFLLIYKLMWAKGRQAYTAFGN